MWVAESARGLGVGRRMLAPGGCARDNGAAIAHIETNGTLVEAISLICQPAMSRFRRSTTSRSPTTGEVVAMSDAHKENGDSKSHVRLSAAPGNHPIGVIARPRPSRSLAR